MLTDGRHLTMALLAAVWLLACSIPASVSISLADHVATNPQNLLPASRLVDLKLFRIQQTDAEIFERSHQMPITANNGACFSSLLRRRDGLSIYGKDIVHGPEEPNYATLSLFPLADSSSTSQEQLRAVSSCGWEATLLITPESKQSESLVDGSCFVAMNRFAVKQGCELLFEERWAERQSKLPQQPGFLSFCLIRQQNMDNQHEKHDEVPPPFNYSSLTLWKSFESWTGWRNGDGRYSHDASRAAKRTPVSEWLEHPASPIFWDGLGTSMAESGI